MNCYFWFFNSLIEICVKILVVNHMQITSLNKTIGQLWLLCILDLILIISYQIFIRVSLISFS